MRYKVLYMAMAAMLLLIPLSAGCKSNSSTTTAQIVTVQKGALSVTTSATGNLGFSDTDDLAFDIAGNVYKVLVEVGDKVTKGQVVAAIDSYDWDKQQRSLQTAVIQSKVSLNNAIISLEKAENPTTTTSTVSGSISAPDPLDIETKKLSVQSAKIAVDSAQKELDRYNQTSPQVKATMDGVVTSVNVKGGDEIYKGSIACTIANPNLFKVDILVSELDINNIKLGQTATVQPSSSSSSKFPAKVTKIAPTATNSSGVVNYQVEVELLTEAEAKALQAAQITQTPSGQMPTGLPSAGQKPTGLPSSGQIPTGMPFSTTNRTGTTAQSTTVPVTLADLRQGFSVTVVLTTQEKKNVLMLLSKAISRSGTDRVVKIPNGKEFEVRVVKTGISNSTYTEITEGLNEGDQVAIVSTTTSSSSTSTSRSQQSGIMGGMGGPPPGGF
jgi:HlyD family secretion protein